VITGSHAMVTDNLPWSVGLEQWVRRLLDSQIPVFGICYGHQLLAQAAGGRVDYHPGGEEIGTVAVRLLPECGVDPIFRGLPDSFLVHVSHSQTVTRLPESAVRLASNEYEPNHAFRIGECAWGVQFHPEYSIPIMKSYIEEQKKELVEMGLDVSRLLDSVSDTPVAAEILWNFGRYAMERMSGAGKADARQPETLLSQTERK
jgi:GMP synthase (glutamine-hydrolysing)